MRVGLLTLSYRLYGIHSLKERRSIVRHLVALVRAEGEAFAVCEIDPNAGLQRVSLRVAHVSTDAVRMNRALARLRGKIERGDGYEAIEVGEEIL